MSSPKLYPILTILATAHPLIAQDMPLSQVLIPGEGWELAVEGIGFADALTADAGGNFYFSDMKSEQGLFPGSPDGKKHLFLKGATGISGMKFGPDGKKLYACRARARELVSIDLESSKMTVLAKDVRPNDLVVTHKGHIYFTETPKKQVTFLDPQTGKTSAVDIGITAPNGICLSPDQGTLAVSDFRKALLVFRIEPNASLAHRQPYMTMRRKPDPAADRDILPAFKPSCRGDRMITDAYGHYYVTTELGVQYFDPTGRISGVIPIPQEAKGMTSITFAGKGLNTMYITCFDKIYRMKTRTIGILYQEGPKIYPPRKK